MAEDRSKSIEIEKRFFEAHAVETCSAERDPALILIELEDQAIENLLDMGIRPTRQQIAIQIDTWLVAF